MKYLRFKSLLILCAILTLDIGVLTKRNHRISTGRQPYDKLIDSFSEGFIASQLAESLVDHTNFEKLYKLITDSFAKDGCKFDVLDGTIEGLKQEVKFLFEDFPELDKESLELVSLCQDYKVLANSLISHKPANEGILKSKRLEDMKAFLVGLPQEIIRNSEKTVKSVSPRVISFVQITEIIKKRINKHMKVIIDEENIFKQAFKDRDTPDEEAVFDTCLDIRNSNLNFNIIKVLDLFVKNATYRLSCIVDSKIFKGYVSAKEVREKYLGWITKEKIFSEQVSSTSYFSLYQIPLLQEISREFLKDRKFISREPFRYFGLLIGEFLHPNFITNQLAKKEK